MKGVTGVTVGKLADEKHDSVALASASDSLVTVAEAMNPNIQTDPVKLANVSGLGPSSVVAARRWQVGGTGVGSAGPGPFAGGGRHVGSGSSPSGVGPIPDR
jgi:hypothetical protein